VVRVTSETQRLKRVIVQPPGEALERMLPEHIQASSPDYLLFDDLVHLPTARREHDLLRAVLGTFAEVLTFEHLLAEVLEDPACREGLLGAVCSRHGLDDAAARRLAELDSAELTRVLLVGALGAEDLFPPVPNLVFTRDLAAVAGGLVVVANASKEARRREAALAWAVVDYHPLFRGVPVSDCSRRIRDEGGSTPLTLEGGDVAVVSSSLVCIGASERTSWSMIAMLARDLAQAGFTRILVVEMPKRRSSMHLDTVFTLLDWDRAAVYRPILERNGPEGVHVIRIVPRGGDLTFEAPEGDLLDVLADEGHPLRVAWCGGGHPVHARREQWTDGTNYVALAPGVVLGYSRNEHTARDLERQGFRVVQADAFLRLLRTDFHDDADRLIESGRSYAVHLDASELSRGRGGPRCLTLPIERESG
jgi:arginine deiminase